MLAGEYLTDGLSLLIGALFGDVIFEPSPIFAAVTKGGSNHGATRWRVNLMWSLVCDGDGDGEDDEHDEDDELGNDEDDELGNNDEDR